jgi:molecular chaperone DnaJ
MAEKDYYEVIGVSKNADDKQIKKAYKRLAMKHHPDRSTDKKASEKKFKEIQKAYSVLSDPKKRQAYDQFGHAGVNGNSGFEGGNPFTSSGFGDIFGDIFGNTRTKDNNRGSDLSYQLEINLEDVIKGTTVKVKIPRHDSCQKCNGSGAMPGTSAKSCYTCNGSGQIHTQQGFFAVQRTCQTCDGTGQIIEKHCKSCYGKGVIKVQKTLSVKIPAGVDTGNRIRLNGEGEAGIRGGEAGDLYIEIHVRNHNIFQRNDNDLYCEVPISFATAILGGSIEVPTLENKLRLKIPAGTQTGKLFRLNQKGITSIKGNNKGDLICQVKVETPVNLNKQQKQLIQEFADSCGKKHNPKTDSFFSKMKNFFE